MNPQTSILVSERSAHRNNFNLLRLIFALLVIVEHSFKLSPHNNQIGNFNYFVSKIPFGEIAVDGFFLLSGYLIVKSWSIAPEIWRFLRNRFLRIYPGFIVAALVCAIVVGPLGANLQEYISQFVLLPFMKSMVLLLMPALPPVFVGKPYPVVNGSMWTISYEFKCYIAVLGIGLIGGIRVRRIWAVATAGVFCLMLLQSTSVYSGWTSPLIRLSSFFFIGGCFYLFKETIALNGRYATYATLLALVTFFYWPSAEVVFAAVSGFIFFFIGMKHIPFLAGFNRFPDISYGVYLYAWPVQKLLSWHYPDMSPWTLMGISTIATVLLGTLSWYIVEKPFMNLKRVAVHRPEAVST